MPNKSRLVIVNLLVTGIHQPFEAGKLLAPQPLDLGRTPFPNANHGAETCTNIYPRNSPTYEATYLCSMVLI